MVVPGDTEIETPVLFPDTGVVQAEFVYHFQAALVPSDPPETLRLDEPPEEMLDGFAVADEGAVDCVLIVTVTLAVAVELHVPSART